MTFRQYTLLLCVFVFVVFTAVFTAMIVSMIKQYFFAIRGGLHDEEILKEFNQPRKKKKACCKVGSIFSCVLITVLFLFSAYVGLFGDKPATFMPTLKVVSSPSMSSKYEKNKYLFENNLNNQLQTYDLILLHKLPKEEDLKLYDIVVYEMEGYMVVHRIVGIEEPNEKHPNERYFLLQGDAAENPDRFPVKYEQMRSIYRNQRIAHIGSFVFFLQSPAGILCFLLVFYALIALPIIEKKLRQEQLRRLYTLYPELIEYEEVEDENL